MCKSPVGRQYIHHVWGYTMGVPAFTVQPVWWQYKYQPNRGVRENSAFPRVQGVALFQVNFMDACEIDSNGKLVLGPSISPEHWGLQLLSPWKRIKVNGNILTPDSKGIVTLKTRAGDVMIGCAGNSEDS